MKEQNKKTKEKEKSKLKDADTLIVLPKGALVNVMGIPSGRKDGKGEKVYVVYLAGRNPI